MFGPVVAYLDRNDPHHDWAAAVMKQLRPPLLTCEAVMTEAAYFLREDGVDVEPLFWMLERSALLIDFDMSAQWPRMRTLMRRYAQMDVSDASVVVMSETHALSGADSRHEGLQRVPAQRPAGDTLHSTPMIARLLRPRG